LFCGIFIDRPRFAIVIAVVIITLADLIAIRSIPIAQFPDIVPPQVTLATNYPGADPEVIENCRRPRGGHLEKGDLPRGVPAGLMNLPPLRRCSNCAAYEIVPRRRGERRRRRDDQTPR
jgi:hypothetical protein